MAGARGIKIRYRADGCRATSLIASIVATQPAFVHECRYAKASNNRMFKSWPAGERGQHKQEQPPPQIPSQTGPHIRSTPLKSGISQSRRAVNTTTSPSGLYTHVVSSYQYRFLLSNTNGYDISFGVTLFCASTSSPWTPGCTARPSPSLRLPGSGHPSTGPAVSQEMVVVCAAPTRREKVVSAS